MYQWIIKNSQKLENASKAIVFLLGGIVLFAVFQRILMPKWYYPGVTVPEAPTRTIVGFYEEEKDSLEVIMTGTSHVMYGFSPMELYEQYGILSYNTATSGQTIEPSYYILKECLRTQKPKVVIYDVSSMWLGTGDDVVWRHVLDGMKFSATKMEFARTYSEYNQDWSLVGAIFPMWRYHTNWKTLTKSSFTDFFRNKRFYSKGYCMTTRYANSGVTVDAMNLVVEELRDNQEGASYIYEDGIFREERYDSILYNTAIPETNLQCLQKMKELCDENGVELLLTKVPTCQNPIYYTSSWTRARSDEIKNICAQYGIPFFDMLYDGGVEIDWATDTVDGGAHFNFSGACKVSKCLGNYLVQNYSVGNKQNSDWDKELLIYQKLRNVALLELEKNFAAYIQKLAQEYKDYIIFIASSDDMVSGLNEEEKKIFQILGIQTDFTEAFRNSFLAVIEYGTVTYEALSNRSLFYSGKTPLTQMEWRIRSSGYFTISAAEIYIGDKNYSMNSRGINIVVYDEKNDCVLDSVGFDTCAEEHWCNRNYYESIQYLSKLETILMEE